MRKLFLLFILLPFSALAQDTLYVKGGMKIPATITRVENGKVYFKSNTGEASMAEAILDRYYWSKASLTPTKKDNLIVIETADTPEEAFIKLGQLVTEAGFTLTLANKDIGVISTGSKGLTGVTALSLNATIKPGEKTKIILSGNYDGADITLYGVTSDQKFPVYYATSSMNSMYKAWQELDKVAKAYPNGTVFYGKR